MEDKYIEDITHQPAYHNQGPERPYNVVIHDKKTNGPEEEELLYMDALNFGVRFFDINESHWNVLQILEKVEHFVKVTKESGFKLKVFIDGCCKSEEDIREFEIRKAQELIDETSKMPHGFKTIIGDAFRDNGVDVCYSFEANKRDTLAAHAYKDKASILSMDRGFYRYLNLNRPIFYDYALKRGHLLLFKNEKNPKVELPDMDPKKAKPKRYLIVPPPRVVTHEPALIELAQSIYRFGTSTPLMKTLDNPHIKVRPLRQALYYRRNILGPIMEIHPVWNMFYRKDADRVFWSKDKVRADSRYEYLLDDPKKALETFFPKSSRVRPMGVSDLDWENHLYALHAVVYELCALGSKTEEKDSMLDLLRTAIHVKMEEDIIRTRESSEPEPTPEYQAACLVCRAIISLSEMELKNYERKGLDHPRVCDRCIYLKSTGEKKKKKISRK